MFGNFFRMIMIIWLGFFYLFEIMVFFIICYTYIVSLRNWTFNFNKQMYYYFLLENLLL